MLGEINRSGQDHGGQKKTVKSISAELGRNDVL